MVASPLARRLAVARRSVVVALVVLASGCRQRQGRVECVVPESWEEEKNLRRLAERPEARAWLRGEGALAGLAGNRFASTDAGLAYVDRLYSAGAERVVVGEIASNDPGPYVDSLIVRLPQDPCLRHAIFEIQFAEGTSSGLPACDIGQQTMFFWWD